MSLPGARDRLAVLTGNDRQPEVRLYFDRTDRHPVSGANLVEWVKRAPRRHWDKDALCWVVTAFGGKDKTPKDPEQVLCKAGFTVIIDHPDLDPSLREVISLADLVAPLCRQSNAKPSVALVRPRFAGWDVCREILGMGAKWDKDTQRFEAPLTEILNHGDPKKGLVMDAVTLAAAREMLSATPTFGHAVHDDETLLADAATLAYSTGLNLSEADEEQIARLTEVVGDVPDWFGLNLYPYQRLGAIAASAGRNFLADPTGLGKGSPDWVKILTPTGWTTYGDIALGDQVVGSDGKPATVIGVYPRGELDVFKVTFSDGASVVVDGDHLWSVTDTEVGEPRTVETRALPIGADIPLVAPVHFADRADSPDEQAAYDWGRGLRADAAPLPDALLYGPVETRQAFVRGLLSAVPVGSPATTTLPAGVADDSVTHLVRSLGGVVTRVGDDLLVQSPNPVHRVRRQVVSIEPAGRENVTCIAVDADDALYVTEEFIVTHNTRQGLATLAIKDVERGVIVVPPVVLTNWARECEQSGLAVLAPKPPTKAELKRLAKKAAETTKALLGGQRGSDSLAAAPTAKEKATANESSSGQDLGGPLAPPSKAKAPYAEEGRPDVTIVTDRAASGDPSAPQSPRFLTVFRAGRKEPDLPERGILVVPDSLLASRPALRAKIAAWNPDALVYDEAHRARTWSSTRAQAIRDLCDRMRPSALRLPMTATPLFSNPAELCSLLAISGHLGPVFGGYDAFVGRYCKRNHFNQLVANPATLPELKSILREQVWVRRNKMEVLKDLPPKARYAKYVDVDLSGFRAAHDEVLDKIDVWLDAWLESEGDYPNDDDIKTFSRTQIGLMSPLRKAAGLAKVPVALSLISDWLGSEVTIDPATGQRVCDRPVVVWAHHHEVIDAIVEHLGKDLKDADRGLVGVIAGATSADKRGFYVDEFQAGRLPVLVCSISAAGVGITLTRSSDAVFVETDYSVPLVSQAEDRCVVEGQKVMTKRGPVPIETVRVGDLALTHRGNWRPVTDVWSRSPRTHGRGGAPHSRRVLTEISYVGTKEPLVLTHDHEVWARRADGTVGWIEAGALLPGDEVSTPRHVGEGVASIAIADRHRRWGIDAVEAAGRCSLCTERAVARGMCDKHYRGWASDYRATQGSSAPLPEYERRPNGRYVSLPDTIPLDADLLDLIGWYVAEGFASVGNGKGSFISLSLHQDERHIAERHAHYLSQFGIKSRIDVRADSRGIEWRAYSFELASWFKENFGHGAANKHLPEWVFDLSKTQVHALLSAYVNGDGCRRPNSTGTYDQWQWKSASRELIEQTVVLGASLGYRVNVERIRVGESRIKDQVLTERTAWRGSLTTIEHEGTDIWRPIRSVTSRYARDEERLWDLSVEGDESYVVALAAVHNCWRIGQEMPVSCTTLIAEGTLDPHIQQILVKKAKVIDAVLGTDDSGVAVMSEDDLDDYAAPSVIITALVNFAVERHQKGNRKPKAA